MADFGSTFAVGTNLVSLESATYQQYDLNEGPDPGLYPIHSDQLLDWLQASGVTCVRFLFAWEAMQSVKKGPLPAATEGNYFAYWSNYIETVKRLLDRNIQVICEPWQFNAAAGDSDTTYYGRRIQSTAFANFWGKFAASVNAATNNDQRVAFGLINEPHTRDDSGNQDNAVGISKILWFDCAQAAIKAIRNAEATNTILIPGMAYTDCGTFVSNGSAAKYLKLSDPMNKLAVSVHNYNGQLTITKNRSNPTALRDAMAELVTWARENSVKVHVGEIAIDAGSPNGTWKIAEAQWADWDAFCRENRDVILGWCWFAVSDHAWWNTGDSSAQDGGGFHWGLNDGADNNPSVYMNLISSSLG